jgi:hypothetical protein
MKVQFYNWLIIKNQLLFKVLVTLLSFQMVFHFFILISFKFDSLFHLEGLVCDLIILGALMVLYKKINKLEINIYFLVVFILLLLSLIFGASFMCTSLDLIAYYQTGDISLLQTDLSSFYEDYLLTHLDCSGRGSSVPNNTTSDSGGGAPSESGAPKKGSTLKQTVGAVTRVVTHTVEVAGASLVVAAAATGSNAVPAAVKSAPAGAIGAMGALAMEVTRWAESPDDE